MKGIQIDLTVEEQEKIRDYAERMFDFKSGQEDKKQGDGDGLMYDKMGYTAEYMVHKLFERDFGWDFVEGKIEGDITLKCEMIDVVCDIKGSFQDRYLRVPKWQIENKVSILDAYIFVHLKEDFTGGEIVGLISRKRFKEKAELKTYTTECYSLDTKHLKSVECLR